MLFVCELFVTIIGVSTTSTIGERPSGKSDHRELGPKLSKFPFEKFLPFPSCLEEKKE